MRNLLCSSLALALTACATESSPMPDPEDPPVMETPAIQISLGADQARVIRGRSVPVAVTVTRKGDVSDAITVTAEDLPAGVTANVLTIPAGENAGTLELVGDASLELGAFATATIRAKAGSLESSLPIDLHLTDPPGTLDVTFGVGGSSLKGFNSARHEIAKLVTIQPDGKIVVAGIDDTAKGFFLARYQADGTLDADFATGGVFQIPDGNASLNTVGLTLKPDGTILLAVQTGSNTIVYAFAPDGKLAENYGIGSAAVLSLNTLGVNFAATAMAAAPDGTIVLGGQGNGGAAVVRLTPDGNLDTSFDGDGRAIMSFRSPQCQVRGLALRPDGRVIISGLDYNGYNSFAVGQLTADGQPDPTFSDDGALVLDAGTGTGFEDVTLLPDGRIALPGFRANGPKVVALVKPDGKLDTSFSIDGFAEVTLGSITTLTAIDGGIVAVGTMVGSQEAALEKLNLDGTTDASFGANGLAISNLTADSEYGFAAARDGQGRLVFSSCAMSGAELGQIALARFWE